MSEKKQYSKIGKNYSVVSELTIAPVRMVSQDIATWKDAINSARDIHFPRRRKLIELYDSIKLDGKVVTVIEKRRAAISNKDFVFYTTGKEGKPVERIQEEIINAPWFDEMLEMLEVEEAFYGHVCMELVPGVKFPIEGILQIPHPNVVPETGIILPNYMDTTNGVLFRGPDADPVCKKFILEFGKTKNYGLLMSIAQYVIYKRGGFGDWAQFAEIFGMPFRVGKYNPTDPTSRRLLNEALKLSGGAAYAVIPEGTQLDFITTNYGSGQAGIFKDLIQACNDEIAQVALGGTMTTEDGASKAQGEVHKEGEHEISASRLKKIIKFLNGPFRSRLVEHFNYPEAANGVFKLQSVDLMSLKDRITIDTALNNIIEIDPKYFYEKYNVLPPASGPAAKTPPPSEGGKGGGENTDEEAKKEAQKKKTKLSLKLNAYYSDHSCESCAHLPVIESLKLSFEDDVNRLAKLIFNSKLKPGTVDKEMVRKTALKLMAGVMAGYSRNPEDFTQPDTELVDKMRENVFIFSGFKNEKMLREASALLLDDKGNVRPYNEFKDEFLKLDDTYNKTHLSVEYNFAVAQGQMGSKVIQWQELGDDFPNRKYRTAGDDRVSPEHALLNGLVLAGNDPKVDEIMPVKRFGCRCDMDATDEEVNSDKYKIEPSKLGPFKGNIVKTGVVFPENHPYFEASQRRAASITKQSLALIKEQK